MKFFTFGGNGMEEKFQLIKNDAKIYLQNILYKKYIYIYCNYLNTSFNKIFRGILFITLPHFTRKRFRRVLSLSVSYARGKLINSQLY